MTWDYSNEVWNIWNFKKGLVSRQASLSKTLSTLFGIQEGRNQSLTITKNTLQLKDVVCSSIPSLTYYIRGHKCVIHFCRYQSWFVDSPVFEARLGNVLTCTCNLAWEYYRPNEGRTLPHWTTFFFGPIYLDCERVF